MKDTNIIIMLKDKDTGEMTEEAMNCSIYGDYEHYIDGAYAVKNDDGDFTTHIKLTVGKERTVENWQFDAIYDYYDESALENLVESFKEVEDVSDPMWEVSFTFSPDKFEFILEKRINGILDAHKAEIEAVFDGIEEHKAEYEV